jgi:hypothetical protein
MGADARTMRLVLGLVLALVALAAVGGWPPPASAPGSDGAAGAGRAGTAAGWVGGGDLVPGPLEAAAVRTSPRTATHATVADHSPGRSPLLPDAVLGGSVPWIVGLLAAGALLARARGSWRWVVWGTPASPRGPPFAATSP